MALIKYSAGMKKQFTATGYVINAEATRMLMIFHRGLQRWLPPGGHVEPDEFPGDTALREVLEETGVRARHAGEPTFDLTLNERTETQLPVPFAMAAQLIPESPKDIEHIHMDLMYLLTADDRDPTEAAEAEAEGVAWFSRSEVLNGLNTVDSARTVAREKLNSREA